MLRNDHCGSRRGHTTWNPMLLSDILTIQFLQVTSWATSENTEKWKSSKSSYCLPIVREWSMWLKKRSHNLKSYAFERYFEKSVFAGDVMGQFWKLKIVNLFKIHRQPSNCSEMIIVAQEKVLQLEIWCSWAIFRKFSFCRWRLRLLLRTQKSENLRNPATALQSLGNEHCGSRKGPTTWNPMLLSDISITQFLQVTSWVTSGNSKL